MRDEPFETTEQTNPTPKRSLFHWSLFSGAGALALVGALVLVMHSAGPGIAQTAPNSDGQVHSVSQEDVEAFAKRADPNNPVEMGEVSWMRDYDAALALSKTQDKPVMLLFQEVPGCLGCREYGADTMSHPLIVEAAQTLFVPLCIHNNKGGDDKKILNKYNEPSWNYPVVRYVDDAGKDLLPRKDRVYTVSETASRMINALEKADAKAPTYLALLASESTGDLKTATFAMGCFWHGQARIGAIDGVVSARAGWAGGAEVVEVVYDPALVSYKKLVAAVDSERCASRVYTQDASEMKEAKAIVGDRARGAATVRDIANTDAHQFRHLRRTALIHLPLSPAQATKANAAIEAGRSPLGYLSPGQVYTLKQIKKLKETGHGKAFDSLIFPTQSDQLAAYNTQLQQLMRKLESAS